MTRPASTGSIRENADRICRFRPIQGDGFRTALEITRRCNIACLHCFVPNERPEPSLESLRDVIVGLKQAGCRKLILTGGEPLLRDDLEEIVRAASTADVGVDLNSNLVDVSPDRADALVDAGLAEASVSFYGDQVFHDKFVRRKGAYLSTLQSCRLLRARGVELDVHGPVWAENLSHVEHVHHLAELIGAESLTLFKVIGLAGTDGGRLFGDTRFGAEIQDFHPPRLDELAECVERLRAKNSIPVRTIGFWGSLGGECEQGCSIVGLTSDLRMSPCLLSRRNSAATYEVRGDNVVDVLKLLRDEVRRGQWTPVCDDQCSDTAADEPLLVQLTNFTSSH